MGHLCKKITFSTETVPWKATLMGKGQGQDCLTSAEPRLPTASPGTRHRAVGLGVCPDDFLSNVCLLCFCFSFGMEMLTVCYSMLEVTCVLIKEPQLRDLPQVSEEHLDSEQSWNW